MRYDSISWLQGGLAARTGEQTPVRMAFIGDSKPVHLYPNHNSSGDSLATAMLFSILGSSSGGGGSSGGSTCPPIITVIPSQITSQFWLEGASIETLLDAGLSRPESPLASPRAASAAQDQQQQRHDEEEEGDGNDNDNKGDGEGLRHDSGDVSGGSSGGGGDHSRSGTGGFPAHTVLCGSLLVEWLRRRDGQRGQCPHDALTVYEACFPVAQANKQQQQQQDREQPPPSQPLGNDDGAGSSTTQQQWQDHQEASRRPQPCLRYARGTFVGHEVRTASFCAI
jgi:hypothetical protein